jgi:hypothetical protein
MFQNHEGEDEARAAFGREQKSAARLSDAGWA